MSRMVDVEITLSIKGDEQDVFVRGFVNVEPGLGGGGSWGAELDGDVLVRLSGDWWPLESVEVDAGEAERIEQALCDTALEDDSDQCREYPEYEEAAE